jgi:hypothetical protein
MTLARSAAQVRRTLRALATAAVFALLGAVLFVVGAFIHSLGTIALSHWQALSQVSALFAVFGAVFGTIVAFDRSADAPALRWRFIRRFDSPVLRTLLCTLFGVLAVFVVQSLVSSAVPSAWFIVGGICGAILGWFGWRWARFIDF